MKKAIRFIVLSCAALVLLMFVCILAIKRNADSHYYDGYDSNTPLNVMIKSEEDRPDYRRIAFSYDSLPGEAVPSILALPLNATGPFPCVVFLHGIGQDKEFLDEIAAPFVQAGFAIVSYDQFTRGERKQKGSGPLDELRNFKRRGALTVIDTRRMIDVLTSREDMAKDRIYLCGASYGAMTGSAAAEYDRRFRAVALCYGGGGYKNFLNNKEAEDMVLQEAKIPRWKFKLLKPIGYFLLWYLSPSDPVKHVGGISPIPVFFQNGTHDILIPTAAAKAFQEAAKEPKEILWYDSNHVGMDKAHTEKVLLDAIAWLKKYEPPNLPGGSS